MVIPYTSTLVSSVQIEPIITEPPQEDIEYSEEITIPYTDDILQTPIRSLTVEDYLKNLMEQDRILTEKTTQLMDAEVTESLQGRLEKAIILKDDVNLMEQNRISNNAFENNKIEVMKIDQRCNKEVIIPCARNLTKKNSFLDNVWDNQTEITGVDDNDNGRKMVIPYTNTLVSSVQIEPIITEPPQDDIEYLHERLEKTLIIEDHHENLTEEQNNILDNVCDNQTEITEVSEDKEYNEEITIPYNDILQTPIRPLTVEDYLKNLTEQQDRILTEKTTQLMDAILEIKRRAKNAIMTIPVK
ncbi:10806_t:CDS:1 [Scutellospora calospora]|uniref:10806_t:CDS:1 n=1 Tax=Scutellospora calospora TaxID=85575 RepID=A0ACA9M6W7_9GLOM|nr:10806_t:CDS:1 [Scutellospora calospora]